MNNPKKIGSLDVLLLAWLAMVTLCVTIAWFLTIAGLPLVFTGWLVLVIGGAVSYKARKSLLSATAGEWKLIREEKLGFFLFALIVLASLLFLPAVQDSIAYRIPRIRFWLQDGGLSWIGGGDYRMNTMGRNWEWQGLGILSLGLSDRFLSIPSVLSWFFLWRILSAWSSHYVSDAKVGRALLVVFISSPVFVIQATSTMNDLFGAALVSVSVYLLIRAWQLPGEKSGQFLVASGLALALASGVKPNYATMCLFWLLGSLVWFFKGQGRLPWKHMAWAIPVALIGSCFPTLWLNWTETGYLTGTDADDTYAVQPATPWGGALFGSIMFWVRSVQPALNPLAGQIAGLVAPIEEAVSSTIPRFRVSSPALVSGSGANLGFFSTLVVLCGGVVALVRYGLKKGENSKVCILLFVSGVLAMGVNFAFAVPNASPRSSIGFVIPMIPLALCGFNFTYQKSWRNLWVVYSVGAFSLAILLLLIEPYRPLLTSKGSTFVVTKIFRQDSPKVRESVLRFRERVYAGKEIFEKIPRGETEIAICFKHGTNLTEAWRSVEGNPKVRAYKFSDLENGLPDAIHYLVVASVEESYGDFDSDLNLASTNWREVDRKSYLQQVSKGEKDWVLYQRN